MLVVKPVRDKEMQKMLCLAANAEYDGDAFAYFAANSSDTGETYDDYIGMLQFDIFSNGAKLITMSLMPNCDDVEAMIIMLRSAMHFMYYSCGLKMLFAEDKIEKKLLEASGFENESGRYYINLEEFYKSPCGYKEKHK